MDFGVVIPTYGPWADPVMIRDAVQAAEELGYASAWFGDHIVIPGYAAHLSAPRWFDALACALVGLGATRRLRFGVDVLVLPYRHPVALSQLIASADQLSNGRLILGVGVGYISGEFAAVGAPPYDSRGAVTDEYLDVLRRLWEGEGGVSFSGRWVSFTDVHAEPRPQQQPFPLWVGGNGRSGRRRAAHRGNGWHPLFPSPEAYARGRAEIIVIRQQEARTGPFTFSYSCPACWVFLNGEARNASTSYADLGVIPDEYRYAPPYPVAADGRPRLRGTPEEVRRDVNDLARAGVDHLALRFWTHDPEVGVDAFVEQLQRFQVLVADST